MYRWQITSIYRPNAVIREGFHHCWTATVGIQFNIPKREEEEQDDDAPVLPF
jgi:hypothetical protein